MSKVALDKLKARFGAAILETHDNLGDDTAIVESGVWRAVAAFLREDAALDFDMFIDLCGVDFPKRTPRM